MSLFNGISSNDGGHTIHQAITSIVQVAQEQGLTSRKWSLVELRADNDDFEWLCDWAKSLSGSIVQCWLEEEPWRRIHVSNRECSYATALGTLLLLFTVEVARRRATEGHLWITLQQDCFSGSSLRFLYASGQPTRAHKDALEAAARWLNLRHVFGIAGLQNWFDTIYLQFGFTHRGFLRRLPEWLVGQGRTQAIQHLLEGEMQSKTFCALWDDLRNLRRGNIKAERLRITLARNPWILPEWIDDLISQATAKIELGYGAETKISEEAGSFEPFLDGPILRWDLSKSPQFVCHVSNIAKFDLIEPTYKIVIGGRSYVLLQRNDDDIYTLHPSEEIILPTMVSQLVASLVSATGQIIASMTLQLWNSSDDVNVFRTSSGRRIVDAWQETMRSEVSYLLLAAADLTITPEPLRWCELDTHSTKTKLYFIEQGWPSSMKALLAGQILWQPNMKRALKSVEPKWAQQVDISLSTTSQEVAFGDEVQVEIRHSSEISVSFMRFQAKPVNVIEQDAQHTLTEPFIISPDILFNGSHLAELCFTLGLRNDVTSICVSRSLSIEVVGAAILSSHEWTVLQPEMTLTLEQAKTLPVQIFRPQIKRWALVEGNTFLGRPHQMCRPIGSVGGLGAPVKLRLGPYNALQPDIALIHEVIDRGILTEVSRSDDISSNLILHLVRPIELDQRHSVIIWDADGRVYKYTQENSKFEVQVAYWSLHSLEAIIQPLVVAIAYDGVRIGAWWQAEWSNILQQQYTQQQLRNIAAMLRWFQLPLLSKHCFATVQKFVSSYGSIVLPIWIADSEHPLGLQWHAIDDYWLSAVRTLFKNWRPSEEACRKLIKRLGGTSESLEDLLLRTVWCLLRVDPLLMGKVVSTYANKGCLPHLGIANTRKLLHVLVSTFAESVYDDIALYSKKTLLLEEVSDTMGYLDTNFIKRGLIEPALQVFKGNNLKELSENNLALALNIEPFRRLLGIHILEAIEQTIVSQSRR